MKRLNKKTKITILLAAILLISLLLPDYLVIRSTKKKTYDSVQEIPSNRVGLILGTSKFLRNGDINLYYKYRIEAAVQLFKSGRIRYILVSGDNSKRSYDEPTTMKNDLIAAGIPASVIYLDYAGFRTLDSIIRTREIFGQDSITIISQRFHNERAIYIADHKNMAAIGFNARDVNAYYGFKTRIRELLARDKMIIDLIFNKKSRYLGEKVEIR